MLSDDSDSSSESGDIQTKSLDELENARRALMEQLLSLPDDTEEPLSPLGSPVFTDVSYSPSPKKRRLSGPPDQSSTFAQPPNVAQNNFVKSPSSVCSGNQSDRAAGGRDSSQENGILHSDDCSPPNNYFDSPVSALRQVISERMGCKSPEFSSRYDRSSSCWRTEVVINSVLCGSGEGASQKLSESNAAGVVLEKYSMEEGNSSFDISMESVNGAIIVSDESSTTCDDDDSDLDVDELLEKPFGGSEPRPSCPMNSQPVNGRPVRRAPMYREKIVLRHRSTEYFEVLPDGWIEVTHKSGLPVYLHKATRVCTFSRPYFLGPGSVRNHDVPVAAIPCLHQKKIREKAKEEKVAADLAAQRDPKEAETDPLKRLGAPQVQVQTAKDFKRRNLNPSQLHEYAKKAFQFDTAKLWRFRSWSQSRNHLRKKREQNSETLEILGRPTLPSNIKLITVPSLDAGSKPTQKQFFMNPQGKTIIAVLHEYVQKVLKGSVKYVFTETKNAANPYGTTVKVIPGAKQRDKIKEIAGPVSNGATDQEEEVELGSGYGNSKKIAKSEAAKKALQVLIPGLDFDSDGLVEAGKCQDDAIALFDLVAVTDTRVVELSAKSGQPPPFIVLQECLKRHSAFGNTRIHSEMVKITHQSHQYTMKVGKHEVTVPCTNKKEGKQKAAQFMLAKLHNQIKTWGSLLRLYGYGAQRKLQEARKEKDSIINLQGQSRPTTTEPNHAILEKLKQEMQRLFPSTNESTESSVIADSTPGKRLAALKTIDI